MFDLSTLKRRPKPRPPGFREYIHPRGYPPTNRRPDRLKMKHPDAPVVTRRQKRIGEIQLLRRLDAL